MSMKKRAGNDLKSRTVHENYELLPELAQWKDDKQNLNHQDGSKAGYNQEIAESKMKSVDNIIYSKVHEVDLMAKSAPPHEVALSHKIGLSLHQLSQSPPSQRILADQKEEFNSNITIAEQGVRDIEKNKFLSRSDSPQSANI